MAWQDVFPVSSPRIDAEEEREMRLAMQARAGAEWALTALIARYQPPVTRYLTRLTGNPERARVLAERIFVRMERRIHGPQGGRYLRLWLLRSSTEDGLDALRKPRRSAAPPRLGAPLRPLALLDAPGVAPHIERLRAGIGAIAGVTGQTSRQVRKLIWPDRDRHDADARRGSRTSRQDDEADDADEPDAREALRYRMIRAILAELPYARRAMPRAAPRRRAEPGGGRARAWPHQQRHASAHRPGLQLFSQRYDAAVAALGLSPDMLADGPARCAARSADAGHRRLRPLSGAADQRISGRHRLAGGAERLTPDLLEAVRRGTDQLAAARRLRSAPVGLVQRQDGLACWKAPSSTRCRAMPRLTEAHPLILAEPMLITADTTPLPPQDEPPDALPTPIGGRSRRTRRRRWQMCIDADADAVLRR